MPLMYIPPHDTTMRGLCVIKSMQSDLIVQPIAKNILKNFNNTGLFTYFEEL
jgi:hypothetical protein